MILKTPPETMNRCLGLREAITITTGTVIGVGLFTIGANIIGIMGSAVILATLAALLISIYPSLLYAEMSAALPLSGGTYQYASLGLGKSFGMLAGWNFIISMVAVASGEALAFSFYIKVIFEAIGVTLPISDSLLACLALFCFLIPAIRGIQFTGKLQNGFLFFFWGVAIVWILSMLPHMHWGITTIPNTNSLTISGFLPCVAMIWWCFAGFETCCAMGEEIRHPQINLPRALFLAPFIVFAVNGLFQWALTSIIPAESLSALADAAAPYAEGMRQAGIIGFPLILLCLGIAFGGDFSTLNASIAAPARYLYTMACDGILPRCLGKLHPQWKTPVRAILLLGVVMILLVSTNSINYIASLSLFSTLIYYIIGMAAAYGLRKRYPRLERPYRAPAIKILAPLNIIIYILMITQLDSKAILSGIIWCAIGVIIFVISYEEQPPLDTSEILFNLHLPEPPLPQERQKMDREYRRWVTIVTIAVLITIILNLTLLL